VSWFFDLGLAGLVFIGLCVWLIRKVAKAAGTEGDLEAERLQRALADELALARSKATATATTTKTATATATANRTARATATATATATQNQNANKRENDAANQNEQEHENVLGQQEQENIFGRADVTAAAPAHLPLISDLVAEREQSARAQHKGPTDVPRRIEVLWVRSTATHAVWCERRHAATLAARAMTREVICVALIERGRVTERWSFG
jgi:hypothetical protein